MPKKKVNIGGLTKLSADYCETIDVEEKEEVPPTPAPTKAKATPKKAVKIKEEVPPPPAEDSLESDEEEVVPEPAKNMKARQMSEENKQALRNRLALMREKQKQLREEKALQKVETKKPLTNLDDIFEKKYNSHFDFLREKLTALTDDITEMKRAKQAKAELKAKAEEDRKIREEMKKTAPPPQPKPAEPKPAPVVAKVAPPAPVVAPKEQPYVFKPPINDIGSFRQQFKRGNFN